jgi:hypothetical protein
MRNSTFRQPVPPALSSNMATGYTYVEGVHHAEGFEYFQVSPAGALSSTSGDIARFMIAHLQNGRYGDTRILSESSAQAMHMRQFAHDPRVNGTTYGFFESRLNNQRLIWHGGDSPLFKSMLVLIPEQNVGLFVSYNSAGGQQARAKFVQAYLDQYYPVASTAALTPPADFNERAGAVTGSYRHTRTGYTNYRKLRSFLEYATIRATDDGYLVVTGLNREPTRWVEVEPLVFRQVDETEALIFRGDTLVFRANDAGQVTPCSSATSRSGHMTRSPGSKRPSFNSVSWESPLLLSYRR